MIGGRGLSLLGVRAWNGERWFGSAPEPAIACTAHGSMVSAAGRSDHHQEQPSGLITDLALTL